MAKNKTNKDPIPLILMRLAFKTLPPLLPTMMGRYAYNLWITPARTKVPEAEQIAAKKAKASFITVDGLKIRVWSWGQGPTVLFIHGWGGRGTQISSYIEALNQAGFNVMSFDMPAHGQSDGKQSNAFEIANVLNAIIKQIDDLHSVMTHSFGGIIFGVYYNPTLTLKNIIMFCPPSDLKTAFNQFSDTLQLPQSIQDFIVKKLKADFGSDVFEKVSLLNNGAKIRQPVLVVHDKQDDVVPFQDGKAVDKILAHGTLYETTELGHRKVLFDKVVVEHVLQYLIHNQS
jgi:pimeloyl-ACP methyl ester carboxylesterase